MNEIPIVNNVEICLSGGNILLRKKSSQRKTTSLRRSLFGSEGFGNNRIPSNDLSAYLKRCFFLFSVLFWHTWCQMYLHVLSSFGLFDTLRRVFWFYERLREDVYPLVVTNVTIFFFSILFFFSIYFFLLFEGSAMFFNKHFIEYMLVLFRFLHFLTLVFNVQLILCPNISIVLRHSNDIAFWMLRWFKKLTSRFYDSLNSCNDTKCTIIL